MGLFILCKLLFGFGRGGGRGCGPCGGGRAPWMRWKMKERLANMTPEERIEFRIGQERQNISGALAQQGFQTADTIDAMRFERLCEKNPAYDGVSAEVDKRLGELRAKGQNVERKILANVVLGEKAAAAAGKKTVKAVVRTKAKAGAGSDVPGDRTRTRQPKTARERLENVKF